MRSLKTQIHVSKKILDSLISGFNTHLTSRMVKKGLIHGELEYFLTYIQNLN